MPVSLGLFWTALTATGCDLWQSRWNLGRASLLGLLLGIGGQILGAFWLMLFPCSLWITLAATGTRRRRLSLGLLALLCGMAALLPTLAHNVKRGQWTPITTHGGLNFYMGNNPSCAGYGTAIPGLRLSAEEMTRDSTALASQLSGRNLSAAAADRYWKQQAWLFWRQTPAQALRLLCKKCHRLVSVRDFDDIGVLRLLVESVRTLPWTFVGFGLVWLCACAGYGLRPCRQINPGWWIMAGGFVSGMLLTFVTARYRLPLAVLLLPAAGATVAGAWTALMKYRWSAAGIVWRNKRSGVKLRWLAGLAGIGLSLAPHSLPDTTFVDNYNRANHWYQAGDAGKTMTYALQAVNQRRDSPEAWFLLGNAWMLQTNYAAALDAYGRVLKFQPDRTDALFNAGRALENLGDAAGAQIIFEQIVELDPRHAKAWFSLAILYRRTNQTTRSRDALAEAAGLVGWDHPDIRGELRIESRLPADQRP
jgi:predicted TPR repeat methyltransferase